MFIATTTSDTRTSSVGAALLGILAPTGHRQWPSKCEDMPLLRSLADCVARVAINMPLLTELFASPLPQNFWHRGNGVSPVPPRPGPKGDGATLAAPRAAGAHVMRESGLASPSPRGKQGRGEGEWPAMTCENQPDTLQTRLQFPAALDILVRGSILAWAMGLTNARGRTRMSALQTPR